MRHFRTVWALSLVAAVLGAASACSDQGEGERCDKNNNDADCESGLVCTRLTQLGQTGGGAICCPPPDGPPPTVSACRGRTVFDGGLGDLDSGGGTGGSPSDSGAPDAAGADASPDSAP